jgi:hypothetical protein
LYYTQEERKGETKMDMNQINEALTAPEQENVTLTVSTLAGVRTITAEAGKTVAQIKRENDLGSVKFVTEDGILLGDNEVIDEDMNLFISASKQNG